MGAALRPLVDREIISREEAIQIVAAEASEAGSAKVESLLQSAVDRARWERVDVRGGEAEAMRRLLRYEREAREATIIELNEAGPTIATVLERTTRLATLDALAALGRRDPLGIGAVAGYVSAVEAQAIRLRAMIARVRASLRRQVGRSEDQTAVIHIHDLEIHPGRRSVLADGQPVDLTYTEFQVLYILARRPGWVFTRGQIVDAVRGDDYPVTDRSVDVQIVGLRKKLGAHGDYIETVRGVGYRFKENP